ncbi:retrovirus-related pol polyprotein from transposon TNT 1-94 [Tanacetum coccineum]
MFFKTKIIPSSKGRLQLLHMDLCGPMRVESTNGKKYVQVIVDDYSRYTWTHFLRSKDETPEVLIDFLRLIQRGLYAQGSRFTIESVNIEYEWKPPRCDLCKIFGHVHDYCPKKVLIPNTVVTPNVPAPTAEKTNPTSTVVKTNDGFQTVGKKKKKNDKSKSTNVGQTGGQSVKQKVRYEPKVTTSAPKKGATNVGNASQLSSMLKKQPTTTITSTMEGNITMSNSYVALDDESEDDVENVYNESANLFRTKHVKVRLLSRLLLLEVNVVLHLHSIYYVSSDPALQCPTTTLKHESLSPDPQSQANVPIVDETVTTSLNVLDMLFSPMFDEYFNGASPIVPKTSADPTADKSDKPPTVTTTKNINQADIQVEVQAENVMVDEEEFINIFSTTLHETKDHPLEQVLGNPSQLVRTRRQLDTYGEMCMFALDFEQIDVWELVDKPLGKIVINIKWLWKNIHDEENTVIRNKARIVAKDIVRRKMDIKTAFLSGPLKEEVYVNQPNRNGMTSCDGIGTPMATIPLDADLSGTLVDQTKYQSMVRSPMHLTENRPDIVHATCYCARYQARLAEKYLKEVKRIFRYLKNTIHMGL